MNSGEAPGALVSEWIGYCLADLMGLTTFDYCIYDGSYSGLLDGQQLTLTGPMFCARWVDGHPWSGLGVDLQKLKNPGDIAKLIVLDTWLRNPDRKNPQNQKENLGNVFIEKSGADRPLIAMDFSLSLLVRLGLTSPATASMNVSDASTFSLFDEFKPFIGASAQGAIEAMCGISHGSIQKIIQQLPDGWGTTPQQSKDLEDLLTARQQFLCKNLSKAFSAIVVQPPFGDLQ